MARPKTPLLWFLFSMGGTVAAFLIPVHLFLFGLAFPLGWIGSVAFGANVREDRANIAIEVNLAGARFSRAQNAHGGYTQREEKQPIHLKVG